MAYRMKGYSGSCFLWKPKEMPMQLFIKASMEYAKKTDNGPFMVGEAFKGVKKALCKALDAISEKSENNTTE